MNKPLKKDTIFDQNYQYVMMSKKNVLKAIQRHFVSNVNISQIPLTPLSANVTICLQNFVIMELMFTIMELLVAEKNLQINLKGTFSHERKSTSNARSGKNIQ